MKIKTIAGHWEKTNRRDVYLLIGILTIVLVVFLSVQFAFDQVTLKADGQIFRFRSMASTVGKVLRERGIILNKADLVEPGLKTKVSENITIEVFRSFSVKIITVFQSLKFNTAPRRVREILDAAKIPYDADDKIIPGLDEIVDSPRKITVVDVSTRTITERVTAKPGVEYRKDKSLENGTQKIIREGRDGIIERKYKVVYENARERRRFIIAEKIIKSKVNAIIALGIKPLVRVLETSRGSYRYLEMKLMDSTAYSPGPESCGKYAKYGRTYTGKKAGFGIVAVDPRTIPLGTLLYIEGYGKAEAADIGSAIKGNRIDLCFETYREAVMYGRKKIKVYILE